MPVKRNNRNHYCTIRSATCYFKQPSPIIFQSVTRPKPSEEDEEKKEMAEAAFREWLKRKAAEPHTPRASPSRSLSMPLGATVVSRHGFWNLREPGRIRTIGSNLLLLRGEFSNRADLSTSEGGCTASCLQQLASQPSFCAVTSVKRRNNPIVGNHAEDVFVLIKTTTIYAFCLTRYSCGSTSAGLRWDVLRM
ncbi:hypothetical protein OSTOST_04054 [Ostertagia ostertagi]